MNPRMGSRTRAALWCVFVVILAVTAGCAGRDDSGLVDSGRAQVDEPASDDIGVSGNRTGSQNTADGQAMTGGGTVADDLGDTTDDTAPDDLTAGQPSVFSRPPAPNGRLAPLVATDPDALAAQLLAADLGLRDPRSSTTELADFGHLQQVAIRKLARHDDWTDQVTAALPQPVAANVELHLTARRALRGLLSGYDAADFVPAWEIIDPESPEDLLSHYLEGEALTGIEWEYLAAINLIETGMGRIRGLSSAGAQGPMQFIPTTWEEVGEGDVDDPRDAIVAAARYLVRRGGPEDMESALWGYNNSDEYVASISAYAELLRRDADAFIGLWNWEIYFFTDAGDVWLPVGYRSEESIELLTYLTDSPWSLPDPGLRGP